MFLASLFPISSFVAAGTDVTPMPPWLSYLLPALGLAVLSAVTDALNEVVRKKDAARLLDPTLPDIAPGFRIALAVLNALAINAFKARQQVVKATDPTKPGVGP